MFDNLNEIDEKKLLAMEKTKEVKYALFKKYKPLVMKMWYAVNTFIEKADYLSEAYLQLEKTLERISPESYSIYQYYKYHLQNLNEKIRRKKDNYNVYLEYESSDWINNDDNFLNKLDLKLLLTQVNFNSNQKKFLEDYFNGVPFENKTKFYNKIHAVRKKIKKYITAKGLEEFYVREER